MKNHLGNVHQIIFEKQNNGPKSIQLTIKPNIVDLNLVNYELSKAFGTSTAAIRILENPHLVKALNVLNCSYKPPSRRKATKIIVETVAEHKLKIKQRIANIEHVAISTDFWSDKTLGYVGVNVLFFENNQRNSYLISLKHVPHAHTGQVILRETNAILEEFGLHSINDPKIACIVTYNGSNILKACSNAKSCFSDLFSVETIHNATDQKDSEYDEGITDSELFSDEGEEGTDLEFFFTATKKRLPCMNHKINNNLKCAMKKSTGLQIIIKEVVAKLRKIKNKGNISFMYFIKL